MTHKKLNFDLIEDVITGSTYNRPLLYQFPSEGPIQRAYVGLSENGIVYAEWEIPLEVPDCRDRRWYVDPWLSCQDLGDLLDEIRDDLQIVYNGLTIEWDGDNTVGRLSAPAIEASDRIGEICNNWEASELDADLDTYDAYRLAGQERLYWDD